MEAQLARCGRGMLPMSVVLAARRSLAINNTKAECVAEVAVPMASVAAVNHALYCGFRQVRARLHG